MMDEIFMAAVVFYALFQAIKLVSEHLLKRKLIKAEQYEKVGILEAPKQTSDESNRYPSLKWGLVAFSGGMGLIIIEVIRSINPDLINYRNAVLPMGIVLVFVSLGFLIYFFIMNSKKK
jgi:hypothetical protein